jgi:hypothetical protein
LPHCGATALRRPAVFGGPINGEAFLAYVRTFRRIARTRRDRIFAANIGPKREKPDCRWRLQNL